jgi:hypothetical protein
MNREHGMPNAIVAHSWVDTPAAEEVVIREKAEALPIRRATQTSLI